MKVPLKNQIFVSVILIPDLLPFTDSIDACMMNMGSYYITKNGSKLLKGKCHLKLLVERNMDTASSQNVPDISVQGTLSRLEAVLDLQQYQLVRGFLSYNLGEPIDEIFAEPAYFGSYTNLLSDDIVSVFACICMISSLTVVSSFSPKANRFGLTHQ